MQTSAWIVCECKACFVFEFGFMFEKFADMNLFSYLCGGVYKLKLEENTTNPYIGTISIP